MRATGNAKNPKRLELQSSYVYGPVHSRRLGLSLGINVLPTAEKYCTMNCRYCQYGWTLRPHERVSVPLPSAAAVLEEIEKALRGSNGLAQELDYITFSGNGEPTLHPEFPDLVEGVRALRDRWTPEARLAILTNSTTLPRLVVRRAVAKIDAPIVKLDAGNAAVYTKLNRPLDSVPFEKIIEALAELRAEVGDRLAMQSLFVQGTVDNTAAPAVEDWLACVESVKPGRVQVYTLDRVPADEKLLTVARETLEEIARRLNNRTGIPAEVFE